MSPAWMFWPRRHFDTSGKSGALIHHRRPVAFRSTRFRLKVRQVFRSRCNPRQQQMFARPRAGDVEQSPFGFVDIVQFGDARAILSRHSLSISTGIATSQPGDPLEQVVKRADLKMLHAKRLYYLEANWDRRAIGAA